MPLIRTDVDVRARRALVAGLLGVLAVAVVAAFAVVNLAGGGDARRNAGGHGHGTAGGGAGTDVAPGADERALGPVRVARAGSGEVRLRVFGEVPGDVRVPDGAVPAGTPLRLAFATGGDTRGATLQAQSLPTGGGAPAPVALDRRAAFLLNTRTGDIVLPAGVAGGGHGAHTDPGAGLAGLSPSGGFAWAAKLPPAAGAAVGHDGSRFLAVPYPEKGRIELVDLLRRTRAGAVEIGGRVGPLAFEPGGARLWAVDEEAGRLVGVDPRTRDVVARVPVGAGAAALAVDGGSARAVVVAGERATLVDLAAGRALGARPLAAPAAALVAAPESEAWIAAHGDGRVSLIPATAQALGAPQVMRAGGQDAGTSAMELAPDGRTAVLLHENEDAMALLDLDSGRVLRRVEAREPRDLRIVSHFALARSARGGDVTWVDLDVPERSNVLTIGPGRGLAPGLEEQEALAPSPDARQAYRVHVMHGRPMVMDEIANTIGGDVAVVASGALQATGDGVLEQRTVLDRPGRYRFTLTLPDGARARFELTVAAPRGATQARPERAQLVARVGDPLSVRFTVSGAAPAEAHVLAYGGRRGALRQLRVPARRVGARGYEATLRFPTPGRFRLELLSEEAGLEPGPGTGASVRVRTDG